MNAEELKSKCIEDLTREYKKAIEERDEARKITEDVAAERTKAVLDLGEMTAKRDALKEVAKGVLFFLEDQGVEHGLQERLQLAICGLPEGGE